MQKKILIITTTHQPTLFFSTFQILLNTCGITILSKKILINKKKACHYGQTFEIKLIA